MLPVEINANCRSNVILYFQSQIKTFLMDGVERTTCVLGHQIAGTKLRLCQWICSSCNPIASLAQRSRGTRVLYYYVCNSMRYEYTVANFNYRTVMYSSTVSVCHLDLGLNSYHERNLPYSTYLLVVRRHAITTFSCCRSDIPHSIFNV